MERKRPISITIFGVLGIVLGAGIVVFEIPTIVSNLLGFPSNLYLLSSGILVAVALTISILFIVGGIGILKLKTWGRYHFLYVGGLQLVLTELNFLMYGFFLRKYQLWGNIILGIIILWFFNRDKIKKVFPSSERYLKKEKKVYFINIIIMLLAISVYFGIIKFHLLPSNPTLFSAPQRIDYVIEDKERLLGDYKKRSFLDYSIYIPSDSRLIGFSYDVNGDWVNMLILAPEKSLIALSDRTFFEVMSPLGQMFGVDNSCDFIERFVREKVGMLFLFLKNVGAPKWGRFDEVYFGDWQGFLRKMTAKDKEVYDYVIWHKVTKKSLGITVTFKQGALSEEEIKNIISSVTLESPQKTAKEHFQAGLDLFNKNKYEEAKFYFANAIYQDRQNSQYNYCLGRALFETKHWFAAGLHLKKALADYPDARRLLDEIESKEDK